MQTADCRPARRSHVSGEGEGYRMLSTSFSSLSGDYYFRRVCLLRACKVLLCHQDIVNSYSWHILNVFKAFIEIANKTGYKIYFGKFSQKNLKINFNSLVLSKKIPLALLRSVLVFNVSCSLCCWSTSWKSLAALFSV